MTTGVLSFGSVFAERYGVLHLIGAGGMGEVYEAVHLETNRRRALKVMKVDILKKSDRMRERFRREARVTAGIESEFLVDVFDAGVDEATGLPFLVMELLRGEEIKKRLQRVGRFSAPEAVLYLQQTALALDKTHKAGIIHRDLKPDNLFLTEREDGSPRVKLLDFGIAKILEGAGAHPNTTHEMMGTPLYMAPEQFRMDSRVTAAADIYSIGMIAYTMLVAAHYWKDDFPSGMNVLVFAGVAMRGPQEPPSARARRRGVPLPSAFDAWFARATAVAPGDRFSSALTAVSSLADALRPPIVPRAGYEISRYPAPPVAPAALATTIPMRPRVNIPPVRPPEPSAPRVFVTPGAPFAAAAPSPAAGILASSFSSAKTIPLIGAARPRQSVERAGLTAITVVVVLGALLLARAAIGL